MITAVLKDGSRWSSIQALYPTELSTILRLYSDKAIAGYALAGVPEVISLNVYAVWRNPARLAQSVIP